MGVQIDPPPGKTILKNPSLITFKVIHFSCLICSIAMMDNINLTLDELKFIVKYRNLKHYKNMCKNELDKNL